MPDKVKFLFKSPEESPGYLLGQLTLLWQRKQKKVLDPLNLTPTQFILLCSIAWLSNQRENITQVDIANLSNFDRMMVSKVLRTLQAKKLVTRREHDTDTRAKIVTLTASGKKTLQIALTKIENADIEFFSSIGKKLTDLNFNMQKLIEANKDE
ncbi:MarR family winged helix-turn-helix transcriptional regulator [Parapedobacter sp. DT-150]|uniref:MarR family winged helix-turn-helix transcriptional regulator n=1 Tax=Parapedobacter sp. DT-150 TaxID=3396162 RepID=UPI003F1AA636